MVKALVEDGSVWLEVGDGAMPLAAEGNRRRRRYWWRTRSCAGKWLVHMDVDSLMGELELR